MKSVQSRESDDHALLVLYVADELDAEGRKQLDMRLGLDARLREELNELRSAHDQISREVEATLGASGRSGMSEASHRRLSRAFRQWQAGRLRRVARTPAEPRRSRWWLYPAAAAVALIFWIGWWGLQAGSPEQLTSTQPADEPGPTVIADANPPVEPSPLPPPPLYPPYPSDLQADTREIVSAERELERLELLRTLLQ